MRNSNLVDNVLPVGRMQLHSSSKPGLVQGEIYKATITQTFPSPLNDSVSSSKSFQVAGSTWTLDSALVNSVYPPQGHSDFYNVLPHVLFNNAQIPWSNEIDGDSDQPWVALITFTEDELSLTDAQKAKLPSQRIQNDTLSVSLSTTELVQMLPKESQPITSAFQNDTDLQAIFIKSGLFDDLFGRNGDSSTTPNLQRFAYMSHVRRFNTLGMTGQAQKSTSSSPNANVDTHAVTVSPRTGLLDLTGPTMIYAHLISLVGVKNMSLGASNDLGLTALVSLYSWSYMCVPATNFALTESFRKLGNNIQPLRNDNAHFAPSGNSMEADWVKDRMLAGYSLIRWRCVTGESTVAIHRGLLVPTKTSFLNLPQSSCGRDLAALDTQVGILDLTFSLAWQLGRLLALSDRTFASAVARFRSSIHTKALSLAKMALWPIDTQLKEIKGVLEALNGQVEGALTQLALKNGNASNYVDKFSLPGSSTFDPLLSKRWLSSGLGDSRKALTFENPDVMNSYLTTYLGVVVKDLTTAIGNELYDGINSQISTDWGILATWLLEKALLNGIPLQNLIPDPVYIPKESIRTFYIDYNWIDAFIDGALSLSEYFTQGDDLRQHILAAVKLFFTKASLPKWGLFVRSEVVTKFPNLRITAYDESNASRHPVRADVLDQELLLVLFDSEPGNFRKGTLPAITIQPPEHQLCFMLGHSDGDNGLTTESLTMEWKKVRKAPYSGTDLGNDVWTSSPYKPDYGPRIFDFSPNVRSLNFPQFSAEAQRVQQQSNSQSDFPSTTAALVGSQLIMTVPTLNIYAVPPQSVPNLGNLGKANEEEHCHTNIPSAPTPPHVGRTRVSPAKTERPSNTSSNTKSASSDERSAEHSLRSTSYATETLRQGPTPRESSDSKPRNIHKEQQHKGMLADPQGPLIAVSAGTITGSKAVITYPPSTWVLPSTSGPQKSDHTFSCDLKVSVKASNPDEASGSQYLMEYIEFAFATQTNPSGPMSQRQSLLDPSNQCLLLPFVKSSKPSTNYPPKNKFFDFPPQPNHQGTLLPSARFVGIGLRGDVTTRYELQDQNTAFFYVRIVPPRNVKDWTLKSLGVDLSFVLENVKLNSGPLNTTPWEFAIPFTASYPTYADQSAVLKQGTCSTTVTPWDGSYN